jgi:hypothetical protein
VFDQMVYHRIFTVFFTVYILFIFKFFFFSLNIFVVVLLWSTIGTAVFMESGLVMAGLAAF